jgi:tRNA threonylcarbamoyladenosine biosynthesis protein TsaE
MKREFAFKLEEIDFVAKTLINSYITDYRVWKFIGGIGYGKTTLIAAICRNIKVLGGVDSPSFSIINSYRTAENREVYHCDFFRVKREEELIEIGIEEMFFDNNALWLIEWPEISEYCFEGESALSINLKKNDDDSRIITIDEKA